MEGEIKNKNALREDRDGTEVQTIKIKYTIIFILSLKIRRK